MKKVLITKPIAESGINILQENDIEILMATDTNKETILKLVKDVDAIIARATYIDEDIINAGEKLKIIAQHGVGLDYIDIKKATEKNVLVINTPDANAKSVAEYVVGLMLSLSRKIIHGNNLMKNDEFVKRDCCMGNDLKNKCLGIIGFGRIGKEISKLLSGFEVEIIAYDPYVSAESMSEFKVKKIDELENLLEQSDYVSMNLPGIESLKNMMNINKFRKMKKTAYFINCARGVLVKEEDLVVALKEKMIAGAAIDVTKTEPMEKDSDLLTLENLIITPHIAASTKESMDRMAIGVSQGIVDCLNG